MVPWSSGQDVALSRQNQGFDSPWDYQKTKANVDLHSLFISLKFSFTSRTIHSQFMIKK